MKPRREVAAAATLAREVVVRGADARRSAESMAEPSVVVCVAVGVGGFVSGGGSEWPTLEGGYGGGCGADERRANATSSSQPQALRLLRLDECGVVAACGGMRPLHFACG